MDYNKQAADFLKKTKTSIKFKKSKIQTAPSWMEEDGQFGFKYDVLIERNGQEYKFPFWDSIANKEKEENGLKLIKGETITIKPVFGKWYELRNEMFNHCKGNITIIQARREIEELINYAKKPTEPTPYSILACLGCYEPGSFKDFCDGFGYNEDSKKDTETYLKVMEEWSSVNRLFSDVLEQLQEIN